MGNYEPPSEWFNDWWSPSEFFAAVQSLTDPIPDVDFVTSPECQKLREGWVAGFFSRVLTQQWPILVKLDPGPFPDFALTISGTVRPFELVEAYRRDRQRTKEYREAARRAAAGLPAPLKEFDAIELRDAALPAIRSAVEGKAAKKYSVPPSLLVYVNFPLFTKPPLTPEEFAHSLEPWRDSFPDVWLLWGAWAMRCWPDPIALCGAL